jgi:nucleoid DNA-binding protein
MSGIQELAKEYGLKTESLAQVFEAILADVAKGNKVRIKGFGTFARYLYKGRTLVTPAVNAGEPIVYPDSFVLKFHQSQLAKRRINIRAKRDAAAAAGEKQKKPKSVAPPAPAEKSSKKVDVKKSPKTEVVKVEKETKKKPKSIAPPPAETKAKKPRALAPGEEE